MSEHNKHISEADYRRYLTDEMSGAERNAFEKLLQKYPFEAEALEGLQKISPEKFKADMTGLHERLRKKADKPNRVIWWAAAATLLILVASGVMWFNLDRDAGPPQVAETMKKEKQAVEAPAKKNRVEEPVSAISGKEAEPGKQLSKQPGDKGGPDVAGEKAEITIVEDDIETDIADDEALRKKQVEKISTEQEAEVEEIPVSEREPEIDLKIVENQSAQSNRLEQESVSDFAFSEPAVSRQANTITLGAASKASVSAPNLSAQPMMESLDFESYLREKATLDPKTIADSIVVILKLHVDETGNITQFENANNANQKYFRKARQILRSGPPWQPAMRNGIPMKSVVEQRVVFRKR